jgi:hypothetical protein
VIEFNRYKTYRLLLAKTRLGFTFFDVLGQRVDLGKWTYYDQAELESKYKTSKWHREFELLAARDHYELEGHAKAEERQREGWEPLSRWRLNELRLARDIANLQLAGQQPNSTKIGNVAAIARELRTVYGACAQKPGLGEAIAHLMDDRQLGIDQCLAVLGSVKLWKFQPKGLAKARQNGRQRRKRAACRFCDLGELTPLYSKS